MPTYEYLCEKCQHQFELVQSISDNSLETCPKELCHQKKWGKGRVKRMISTGGGIIFKGSGFYITDYRSEKYKEAAKKDAAATTPAATETKSGGAGGGDAKASKAEVKPAAKTSKPPASD
jgi:putative FmdB family regulatory protein